MNSFITEMATSRIYDEIYGWGI